MPFCIRINMLLSLEVVIVHCKQKWCQMMSNDTSNPQINRVFSTAVVYGISLHWIVLRSNRYCKIIFKMDTYELDLTIGWVFFPKSYYKKHNLSFLHWLWSDTILIYIERLRLCYPQYLWYHLTEKEVNLLDSKEINDFS